jgi:penicillin-binding protein 1A
MNGVTGGHNAAPIWHNFMTVAHTDMNIPPIPGLPLHPVQEAEAARLKALREAQLAAGILSEDAVGADGTRRRPKLMPDKTRDALAKLSGALRKAGGLPEVEQGPAVSPDGKGDTPPGKPQPTGTPAGDRAQTQRNIQTGSTSATGAPSGTPRANAGGSSRGTQ